MIFDSHEKNVNLCSDQYKAVLMWIFFFFNQLKCNYYYWWTGIWTHLGLLHLQIDRRSRSLARISNLTGLEQTSPGYRGHGHMSDRLFYFLCCPWNWAEPSPPPAKHPNSGNAWLGIQYRELWTQLCTQTDKQRILQGIADVAYTSNTPMEGM